MRTLGSKEIRQIAKLVEKIDPFVGSGNNKMPILAPGLRIRHQTGNLEYTIEDIFYKDEKNTQIDYIVLRTPDGDIVYIDGKKLKDYKV
jgi:hypothetical protein